MYVAYRSSTPPECRFVKSDGRRCHAMALRGMAYCYFHLPGRRRPTAKGRPEKPIRIEFEPAGQPQKKPITQIKSAMAQGRLDHRNGELCIYGINLIARNDTATNIAALHWNAAEASVGNLASNS